MKRYDMIIVGAGPAGLSAAVEAAKHGMCVAVFDENAKPGGQLFKQIHKFFGSKEHQAKVRGFRIGEALLKQANELGVEVLLNAVVTGIYADKEVIVRHNDTVRHVKGDTILVATGASENMIAFPGWTLPGVMGAGAAQTMINLHGVLPGKRVLMVGSGNVGLVVSYQLMQCGCELVGIVDVAKKIGGYGVHAAKIARCGVPFYMGHTIVRAEGTDHVTGVVIGEVDEAYQCISGTEKQLDVDTVCIAVGLSPMSQLLDMAGCQMQTVSAKGGTVPVCNADGETSVEGLYVAGDVSGIEEASSAMIEGRIAAISAARKLGYLGEAPASEEISKLQASLEALRQGMFAPGNRGKIIEQTEEGIRISNSLLTKGYLEEQEIERFPGFHTQKGIHPVIECTQNIPCNPCQDVCPRHCIMVGDNITALPVVDENSACSGCGLCVASCSGQAIFLVNDSYDQTHASVTIPYEFLPLPAVGTIGVALDRSGNPVCEAEVLSVKANPAFDKTNLLTMKVPKEMSQKARFFAVKSSEQKG